MIVCALDPCIVLKIDKVVLKQYEINYKMCSFLFVFKVLFTKLSSIIIEVDLYIL